MVSDADEWEIVERQGAHLMAAGQPFIIHSYNTYWLMSFAVDEATLSQVTTTFAEDTVAGVNVCCTWAFNDGGYRALQTTPFCYDEEVFQAVLTRINTITNEACKDDPTIFAWELINEPRYPSDPSYAGEGNTIGIEFLSKKMSLEDRTVRLTLLVRKYSGV